MINEPGQEPAPRVGTVITAMTENVAHTTSTRNRQELRLFVVLAVLLIFAVTAFAMTWLLVRGGGKPTTLPPASGGAAAVSASQLQLLARSVKHPVYWAGPKSGAYELTRTSDGRIYIRYLPSTDKVGDRAAKYLTIGTYPTKTAFVNLQHAAKRTGAVSLKIGNGGMLVFNQSTPKSVYLGYPNTTYQVEVYDPSPQQARTLILSGQIKPIK
jgi:hypothetical protein